MVVGAPAVADNDDQKDSDPIGDVVDHKVLPLSADMSKNEGWKGFYDGTAKFKNQSDCVSFASTGGRNLPAGR